ncbi:MAG: FadR family transcriptional regulator [Acidimicrobiaceae bacterium]|nr:FadR family transcriptional regulator [Acidimicrobiaceae bacterium]
MDNKNNPVSSNPDHGMSQMFSPITTVRISSIIVDRIRALIREGKLNPGDRLPTERELCSSFGIGRATVRDALRILETIGLVEVRVGSRGGAFVKAPSSLQIGAGLNDMLAAAAISAAEVREARLTFELGLIDLVCERVTDEDIAVLEDICARSKTAIEEDNYTLNLSLDFHTALAHSAHNRALDLIIETFQISLEMFERPVKQGEPNPEMRGVHEHYDILEAIKARNSTMAKAIMELHRSRTPKHLRLIA